MRRIGLIGGAAVVIAGATVLAAYQVQQKTMPGWLFWAIVVICIPVVFFGAVAWITANVIIPFRSFIKARRLRSPIVRRDAPDPNQWLLDIAQSDSDNPTQFLIILDSMIKGKDLSQDLHRPWIELGVELCNCNVHTISVRGTTGHAKYKGKELPEPIDGAHGGSNKPRGHKHVYTMKQYLPPEVAAQVYQEIVEEVSVCGGQRRKELRSLDLGGVSIEVECNGHIAQLPLRDVNRFRYD
jgi:hypothetical protein